MIKLIWYYIRKFVARGICLMFWHSWVTTRNPNDPLYDNITNVFLLADKQWGILHCSRCKIDKASEYRR